MTAARKYGLGALVMLPFATALASPQMYQGRPLDYWVSSFEADGPDQVRAAEALHAIGETAVEPLRRLASYAPSDEVRRFAFYELSILTEAPHAAARAMETILVDGHAKWTRD